MDNFIATHEILYFIKSIKELGFLLKLDFEKTFNNVNWH
jgi:hypothetical protein